MSAPRRAHCERERSAQIVEQVIRPTGLLDPEISVRPIEGQIDDLMEEITPAHRARGAGAGHDADQENGGGSDRLIWKMLGVKVRYMHHDVDTMERMEIIRDLRLGEFDVLVGINLLREGLDIPEVSLVAILDADKEGFLRSESSLIQTIGRAARNADGRGHYVCRSGDALDGARPSPRPTAAARYRSGITRSTASSRRPSARMYARCWRSPLRDE